MFDGPVTTMWVLAARSASGGWEPGIGDPTFMGWLTVLCYFAAAGLCGWAWRVEERAAPTSSAAGQLRPRLWAGLALVMVALGINKQLDLQSFLTQVGREAAVEGGWYERRRGVQAAFVAAVFLAGVGLLGVVAWYVRGAARRYRLALIGIAYLVCFIVMRAASFHHVDVALRFDLAGLRLNHVLEIGGIACIGYAAYVAAARPAPAPGAGGAGTGKLVPFEKTVRIR